MFVVDSLFTDQFERLGFPESMVNMLELMDEAVASQYWLYFIASRLPNFRPTAIEQVPNYVLDCFLGGKNL